MNYFRDLDFQKHLLALMCKDRAFLKKVSGLLSADDFKPKKGEGPEAQAIAERALQYWRAYKQPISGMLRAEMDEYCAEQERPIKGRYRDNIFKLVDEIHSMDGLVSVAAVEKKVLTFKAKKAKEDAIEELLSHQEKGTLDDKNFRAVVSKALTATKAKFDIIDYNYTSKARVDRRESDTRLQVYPELHIDPFDKDMHIPPRGALSMVLAKWKMGKSIFFTWLCYAMALQEYNVIYITLEDPPSEVEDRLDGCLTGLPVRRLGNLPNKFKKRWRRNVERLRGRIKIVDGTGGGVGLHTIEEIYEQQKAEGFTADVIIVDYDDEIVPPVLRKGEAARRFEFADIYRGLRQLGAKLDCWIWTAGQAKRGKKTEVSPEDLVQNTKSEIVRGEDAAEDVSKIRKVALCIGIGMGPWGINSRYFYIAANKFGPQFVGWPIMGDFERGAFFDRDAYYEAMKREEVFTKKKKRPKKDYERRSKRQD